MKKLQMNNENKNLIESIIKTLPLYKDNEDLNDLFCEAIYKKTYLLIDAIKDQNRLKRHLVPICETCMEQIIKQSQKFAQIKEVKQEQEPKPTQEENSNGLISLRASSGLVENKKVISLKEEFEIPKNDITDVLIDPVDYRPKKEASEQTVEKLIQIVKVISKKNPSKKYYDIFFLRYLKGLNQAEIARATGLSQAELSKRFVELVKITREKI